MIEDRLLELVLYFAARETSLPPQEFMRDELAANIATTQDRNGKPIQMAPTPKAIATALAKWRFLCAEEMVTEYYRKTPTPAVK